MTTTAHDEVIPAGLPALRLVALRLVLLAAGAAVTTGVLVATHATSGYPPDPLLSSAYFVVVNVICLLVLRRRLHAAGTTIRALAGLERARLLRDIAWGLLWFVVLYLPFVAALMLYMLALYGGDLFAHFGEVFAAEEPQLPAGVTIALLVTVGLTFPVVNAPAEELYFRGWAQSGLARRHGAVLAVMVPAVLFGLQHTLLAPTLVGAGAYAVVFCVWGLVAGVIAHRQRRLVPVIVAHALTNALFSTAAPLAGLLFLG